MKRLAILGGGESGVGTAILGKQKGFDVFLSDGGKIKENYKKILESLAVEWEEGKHSEAKILNANLVMKSPGIPEHVPIVEKLRKNGISIISEIEFASRYTDALLIGITGSNGKTTVTSWVHHILKNGGMDVKMAGNIGTSFAKQVAENEASVYVLELSSFQLDGIVDFRPHISVITNITPDHLDRYDHNFENYIASKFKIVKNQHAEDFFIYDSDDGVIMDYLEKHAIKPQKIPFSLKKEIIEGAFIKEEKIHIKTQGETMKIATADLSLKGGHNIKNAMAASTVAQLLRIRKQTIRESLENFHGVEHRLENVLKINNVQYVNDSKATNVNATYYALQGISTEIIWIVGGVDKGNKYEDLLPLVNEKVKAIICLGMDNSKILEAFGNCGEFITETQSMQEAVKIAYNLAEHGDTVLLSPACASFDLFTDYEDRGRQFKEAVRNL